MSFRAAVPTVYRFRNNRRLAATVAPSGDYSVILRDDMFDVSRYTSSTINNIRNIISFQIYNINSQQKYKISSIFAGGMKYANRG